MGKEITKETRRSHDSQQLFYYLKSEPDDTDLSLAFVLYLMSFTAKGNRRIDPALTKCAEELIRTMIGMDSGKVTVTAMTDTNDTHETNFSDPDSRLEAEVIVVNDEHRIYIARYFEEDEQSLILESPGKNYCVCCNNDLMDFEVDCFLLDRKKLLEICNKYQSSNTIFCSYLKVLEIREYHSHLYSKLPTRNWDRYVSEGFFYHLVKDQIIDSSKRCCESDYDYKVKPCIWWYSMEPKSLVLMGVQQLITEIFLYARGDRIFLCIGSKNHPGAKEVREKIVDFLSEYDSELQETEWGFFPLTNYIGHTLLSIPYDRSNYKEKFQYAQSIVDRLAAEFRL